MRTALASFASSLWRIALTPLDTLKTTLQVEGKAGYAQVVQKMKNFGPTVLYQGAMANALASFVGSYPWFFTFNLLNKYVPLVAPTAALPLKLGRSALLGLISTCVSDCISNSIRVLKTTRQTAPTSISYQQAATQVIKEDGLGGLFGRGLPTRLLTNSIQATLFTVVWKLLDELQGI